jgi:hypothetical protein
MKVLTAPMMVVLTALALALLSHDARALPSVGASRPQLRLVDAWERVLDLSNVGSRPLLVIYEDKDSATQNAALKQELSELSKGDRYKTRVVLAAVADVAAYDYWPVRGFVKDAIRGESQKAHTPIYCDWDGGARRALEAKAGMSNVILYGRDGRVLFAHVGAMSEATRSNLLELLRGEVES